MNAECRELEVLLSLHAAGAAGELEPAEAAALERHLEGCPGCREALERSRAVLGMARLPAPEPGETLALADLPVRALSALRRRDRRRRLVRGIAAGLAGMAVAAALVLALLAPALFRSRTPADAAGVELASARAATWEVPDMDTLWSESAVLDDGSASSQDGWTDAVLAAYDAGAGD